MHYAPQSVNHELTFEFVDTAVNLSLDRGPEVYEGFLSTVVQSNRLVTGHGRPVGPEESQLVAYYLTQLPITHTTAIRGLIRAGELVSDEVDSVVATRVANRMLWSLINSYYGPEPIEQPPVYGNDVIQEEIGDRMKNRLILADLHDLPDDGENSWENQALCKGKTKTMFPSNGRGVEIARKICAHCSVQGPCIEKALANRENFGMWGGSSERERRRILKLRAIEAEPTIEAEVAELTNDNLDEDNFESLDALVHPLDAA